ncbi:MAG: VWA domain-containing protein [Alphaproteobacteria bacterium]|nr:VWA domain-containing protein [Alphaproteobacteria bacterium]
MPRFSSLLLYRLTVLAGLALAVSLGGAARAEEVPGRIIVIFDQSGSMQRYDPKLASKVWLTTFVKTFKTPHELVLVGFDEEAREHTVARTDHPKSMAELPRSMDAIAAKGKVTDFERPIRYLLGQEDFAAIKLVVVISDGAPDVWDRRLEYLSPAVLADERYGDLNARHAQLKAAGRTPGELFDALGTAYHQRNYDLIEGQLDELKAKLANKLVVWDLSGRSYFLRTWAKAAAAQHLPIRLADQEDPVARMRDAMVELQKKASSLIDEPLPADFAKRVRQALETVPETRDGAANLEADISEPQPQPQPQHQAQSPVVTNPARAEPKDVGINPGLLAALLVLLIVLAWALWRLRARARENASASERDAMAFIAHPATDFINDRVAKTLDDAERARRKFMAHGQEELDRERRLSHRVKVPAGAMLVHWTGPDGMPRSAEVSDISLEGLMFRAEDFAADRIERVTCPALVHDLTVVACTLRMRDGVNVVVLLDEFADNEDAWMAWVELQTRIDEVTQ